ncbi:glycolate oxidase [Caldalkalibacillus uzonensis]|uniref:D-lactate dehydrogenase (cytochrome) n=1 Tax=Caldalkalibacillus uzonensis TaxID=353224 RepID=A0ABU0CP47_9BACI|nr:FAD-binding oxidoreductase [Caldalkalibacillus uzonensis]MDQ0338185.1 glycolate oxidase [Caldalkalibacillus uzonensis]
MIEKIISELQRVIDKERVLWRKTDMMTYAYDASFATQLEPKEPEAVVIPLSTDEVQACVQLANKYQVPLYPRGAATGQTGGAVPIKGGIVLDMSKMDRIIEVDDENFQVIVEPGIIQANLNAALKKYGLFFPPDPGSSKMCTVGGMISNNSSGLRAVKYGVTRQYVLGLEIVLPTGEVIVTGGEKSRALKSVSGYDLAHLMIGSEGTLGIVTRIRLKLLPLPPARGIVLCSFPKIEQAIEGVRAVYHSGIIPSAIEIMDIYATRAANKMRPDLNLPETEALLLFEVDGNKDIVALQVKTISEALKSHTDYVKFSDDPEQCENLWQSRKIVGAAVGNLKPGGIRVYGGEDICVPFSRLPEAIRRIHEITNSYNIVCGIYGHVGDGNLHTAPIIDINNQQEVEKAKQMIEEIHHLAIELGGTTTAEHGVGIVRAPYMEIEHGQALDVMRRLKKTLDPNNILNPGKMALPT